MSGNRAKANGYLPSNRPTEFDGMMIYKVPSIKVVIYSPGDRCVILHTVQVDQPELLPSVACAAFLDARVSELALLCFRRRLLEAITPAQRTIKHAIILTCQFIRLVRHCFRFRIPWERTLPLFVLRLRVYL
jgi:hypothetical protein